jgi:TolB-like protein/DNA-binding SARP family transcriptional activator
MLKLLGAASIDASGEPVTGRAAQGYRLALLAILAVARGRPITRDKLIALLWPESPTDRARHQLSDALYIVRGALGEDAVRATGDDLMLNPGAITSDVESFERLLDEGRLEPAVDLYAGPLLDGFHLSDAPEFEHWLDAERARLGQRYAAALESLAEASESRDQFAVAVGWWRRLAARDPYNGRVALHLMRSLEAAGDRAGALQHARIHTALLRQEFDAEPDPDVTAFAERLRVEPPARTTLEPVATRPAHSPAHRDVRQTAIGGAPVAGKRVARRYARTAAALLLVLAVFGAYRILGARLAAPPVARSVGVLPFVNMSPDPANAYFSDGLSEQIIGALSHIASLRVAARTSSFALRDSRLDVRAIGDTLGVAAVLEGSVRKDGNRLRVTAQLIDASTGYHVWSDEYDRELEDVFAVQEEIARAIADALDLRLARGGTATRARRITDLEAYDLYLRGLYLRNSLRADGLRQAMEYFDSAIALEPGVALAYAAKASIVAPQIFFGYVRREEGVREMRELTDRALELDPGLGEAHVALGILRLFFDWDWDGAEQALRRALALNPSDAHAYHHLGNYLSAMGRFREAVGPRERSAALDPLNARSRYSLGMTYALAGDHDRAIVEYRRAQQLDPLHPLALGRGPQLPFGVAEVLLWEGRDAEAVEEYLKIATLRDASPGELDAMRRAFAASGMPGFWRQWLRMDLRQSGDTPDRLRIALLWAMVGDTAQTVHWLERAYDERNPGLTYLWGYSGTIEKLRSHPRVDSILREMKFPDH